MLKSNEESFYLAGDRNNGGVGTHDLSSNALARFHPVRYEGRMGTFLLEVDIFPDLGEGLMVVGLCPKCRNGFRISGKNKRIEFNTTDKRLFVEAFECTWEMPDGNVDRRSENGFGLCRLKMVIENNRAKDA